VLDKTIEDFFVELFGFFLSTCCFFLGPFLFAVPSRFDFFCGFVGLTFCKFFIFWIFFV
jgi:hypothetical protein